MNEMHAPTPFRLGLSKETKLAACIDVVKKLVLDTHVAPDKAFSLPALLVSAVCFLLSGCIFPMTSSVGKKKKERESKFAYASSTTSWNLRKVIFNTLTGHSCT